MYDYVDIVHPALGRARVIRSAFEGCWKARGWTLAENYDAIMAAVQAVQEAARLEASPDTPVLDQILAEAAESAPPTV